MHQKKLTFFFAVVGELSDFGNGTTWAVGDTHQILANMAEREESALCPHACHAVLTGAFDQGVTKEHRTNTDDGEDFVFHEIQFTRVRAAFV